MMLQVSQLVGFGAYTEAAGRTLGSEIATGTLFGDMTAIGGLAASFDGTTSQTTAACSRSSSTSVTLAYVGNQPASAKRVYQVTCYGSSDQGYVGGANPSTTLTLYGKASAPASATDGTSLGSTTFTDTTDESAGRTIISSDQETTWAYIWVAISQAGGGARLWSAEMDFFEAV